MKEGRVEGPSGCSLESRWRGPDTGGRQSKAEQRMGGLAKRQLFEDVEDGVTETIGRGDRHSGHYEAFTQKYVYAIHVGWPREDESPNPKCVNAGK